MATTHKVGAHVHVMLTDKHELDGNLKPHEAVVRAHHLNSDWLEVELTREHAGKTCILAVPPSAVKEKTA